MSQPVELLETYFDRDMYGRQTAISPSGERLHGFI